MLILILLAHQVYFIWDSCSILDLTIVLGSLSVFPSELPSSLWQTLLPWLIQHLWKDRSHALVCTLLGKLT